MSLDSDSAETPTPDSGPPPLPVMATPSPERRLFFIILFFAGVVIHTSPLWGPPVFRVLKADNPLRGPSPAAGANMMALVSQVRMAIGIQGVISAAGLTGTMQPGQDENLRQLQDQLHALARRETNPSETRALLVIFTYFDWPEAAVLRERLQAAPPPEDESLARWDSLIRKLYLEQTPLDATEIADLNTRQKFLGQLATLRSYRLNADPRADELETQIIAESTLFASRLLMGLGLLGIAAVVGSFLLILFMRKVANGTIISGMSDSRVPPHLGFEAMALYLALMFIVPMAAPRIESLGALGGAWTLPITFILAAGYALTQQSTIGQRVGWPALRSDLGLHGGRSTPAEIVHGVAGYVGFLPLMGLAVMFTVLLSRFTGMDQADGAHPIVPVLLGDSNNTLLKVAIFALAVVVAPITEEIIFRGYFYRFLRSRYDMGNSIFISAALFAGIHPQGMMGFFPLLAIGLALGALREWRGSIIAPIIMHACVNGVTLTLVTLMS